MLKFYFRKTDFCIIKNDFVLTINHYYAIGKFINCTFIKFCLMCLEI